jgi:hypothetical protein
MIAASIGRTSARTLVSCVERTARIAAGLDEVK